MNTPSTACYGPGVSSSAAINRLLGPAVNLASLLSSKGRSAPRRLDFQPGLRTLADTVLAANALTDLDERLEEQVLTLDAWMPETAATEVPDFDRAMATPLDIESLTAVLGAPAAKECERGHAALRQVISLGAKFVTALSGLEEMTSATKQARQSNASLASLFYESEAPLPLRRGALAVVKSLVASLVIARAEEHGKKLEPWLAMALARAFSEGFVSTRDGIEHLFSGSTKDAQSAMLQHTALMARYKHYIDYLMNGGEPVEINDWCE